MTNRGKDITQAIHEITNVKPRQKNLAKKVTKKKELSPKDMVDSAQDMEGACDHEEKENGEKKQIEEEVKLGHKQDPLFTTRARDDVPDGAQISKAFDTLCNIVRNRMRRYRKPEPIADFYTKGSYILVTGESSYLDPCFYTTTPSAGHVFVTVCDNTLSPYEPHDRKTPSPPSSPSNGLTPTPLSPPIPSDDNHREKGDDGASGKENGEDKKLGKDKWENGEPGTQPGPAQKSGKDKTKEDRSWQHGPMPASSFSSPTDSMTYEKVEVVESVEKLSPDLKLKGYEETSVVVETMIEKTSNKKQENRAT